MQYELSAQHSTSGKTNTAVGCMDDFYIVNSRIIFHFMGSGCRINTFTENGQSGPFPLAGLPFFQRRYFTHDLFCK